MRQHGNSLGSYCPRRINALAFFPMNNLIFPSVAHAASSNARVAVKTGLFEAIFNASPMVQFLLLIMIGLSIISWAIIYAKYKQFNVLRNANARFSDRFWKATSLETVFDRINEDPHSNLARVFKAAFTELQRIAESGLATSTPPPQKGGETQVRLAGLDNLARKVR